MLNRLTARLRAAAYALGGRSPAEVALSMLDRRNFGPSVREYELEAAVMGSLDELHQLRASRKSVAGKLAEWQTVTPQYPQSNMRTFITSGYRSNPALRACVDMLARTFNQGRLCVVEEATGREVPGHEMLPLVGYPTNVKGSKDRWRRTIQDLYLTGNALWEKVRAKGSDDVVELWRLDPLRVRIELAGGDRWIARYWYEVAGTWYPIPARNVVHWMFPDPLDPGWFGIPPIFSAARVLSIDNELVDQLQITLQNKAVPAVALEAGEGASVDENMAEEARRMWRKRTGGKRQGDVAVLPANLKVKVIGMSWSDMALGEVISVPESRIAMVHGIPMILLGRSGTQADPTRANFRESKLHFWFDTINPLHTDIAELITLYLLPEFPQWQGLIAKFDTSQVPILQEARLGRADKAAGLFKVGMVSRHVAQTMGGIENHGPDVFYRSSLIDAVFPADATEEDVSDDL